MKQASPLTRSLLLLLPPLLAVLLAAHVVQAKSGPQAALRHYAPAPAAPLDQSPADAHAKSSGCVGCHTGSDAASMHRSQAVVLGCTDCHGGDATVVRPGHAQPDSDEYRAARDRAHVLPRFPDDWKFPSSANPERSYTLLNREAPEFIRFINPSDYRVVRESCGACHLPQILAAERSLMATGAMLWGGASYNNGILPYKHYMLGEAYTRDGEPAAVHALAPVDARQQANGILEQLLPLPAWETVKPGDIFRVFEDGGRNNNSQFPEVGLPNATGLLQRLEEPGRPDVKQSNRAAGTGARISVPLINIAKTRLNDPLTWFLGTNDQPGDYRSSGCAACHVVYGNDRDPRHSGPYAQHGHGGRSISADPVIAKDEPGHPLRHEFTRSIPTSQCMVCHMHQPNMFMNTFLGYTMWDYEADAPSMWPEQQKYPDAAEIRAINDRNPEAAAARGKWGDPEFLAGVWELNPQLKDTQFADYHGHGWNFRAVYKRDRDGNLLDKDGAPVANDDPHKFRKAVHLSSVHVDVGMQCVDCHYAQDAHGNGHIYGEVASAIEINCRDCHGTADAYPTLRTSGPAAPPRGHDLTLLRNPDGKRRFEWVKGRLVQRSAVTPGLEWEMSLVKDTVTPGHAKYNAKAARAKLMGRDEKTCHWGKDVPAGARAHGDDSMECYTCHTSWTTSCGGCHLPIEANWKTERHHYEGGESRNFATYNPQVARDEMFMLGRQGELHGNRIAPTRSSSALVLSSTNANRERIYIQQPPISASGFSSQAFNPHYPHTERKTETKTCSDCHLSRANDNNAIMAQLLMQGTGYINFVGRYAWAGGERGVAAVAVTEWEEPQAVYGSYLHRYAYPDFWQRHVDNDLQLKDVHTHRGGPAGCVQLRGEYLYVAEGKNGFRVHDVSGIDNKGISQRIVSAPFSRRGQDVRVPSRQATCVALPTNQPIHPPRNSGELMRNTNREQPFHPVYNYAVVTDGEEGLILVDINTLSDGEFRNNRLQRAVTWNPDGVLAGARHVTLGGRYAYVATLRGLAVVDLDDPLKPVLAAQLPLQDMRASALQFRYLLVSTAQGVESIDVTDPRRPRLTGSRIRLADARRLYIARTWAYVAAGGEGLAIVDMKDPEKLFLRRLFNAGGALGDVHDVIVGSTNASAFAYLADGAGGLKVLQLTAPDTQPNFYGFSPVPMPQLVARANTPFPLLSLSRGLDRDRAVDETGGQIAVFGRLGSRPFTLPEMQKLYLGDDGKPYFVTDEPDIKPDAGATRRSR
ncbi:MAG: hypothetical protein ACOY3X_04710 [Pseudomonadota bacterium]